MDRGAMGHLSDISRYKFKVAAQSYCKTGNYCELKINANFARGMISHFISASNNFNHKMSELLSV